MITHQHCCRSIYCQCTAKIHVAPWPSSAEPGKLRSETEMRLRLLILSPRGDQDFPKFSLWPRWDQDLWFRVPDWDVQDRDWDKFRDFKYKHTVCVFQDYDITVSIHTFILQQLEQTIKLVKRDVEVRDTRGDFMFETRPRPSKIFLRLRWDLASVPEQVGLLVLFRARTTSFLLRSRTIQIILRGK